MPLFNYKATDAKAKLHKGQVEADDEQQVGAQLREQGLTPLSIIEDGKEKPVDDGGLMAKLAIIGISFVVGFFFPLVNGAIRTELMNEGMGVMLGVMTGMGFTAALVAALLTLVESIKSPGKRSLVMVGGIFLIVIIIITLLMVVADIMNW